MEGWHRRSTLWTQNYGSLWRERTRGGDGWEAHHEIPLLLLWFTPASCIQFRQNAAYKADFEHNNLMLCLLMHLTAIHYCWSGMKCKKALHCEPSMLVSTISKVLFHVSEPHCVLLGLGHQSHQHFTGCDTSAQNSPAQRHQCIQTAKDPVLSFTLGIILPFSFSMASFFSLAPFTLALNLWNILWQQNGSKDSEEGSDSPSRYRAASHCWVKSTHLHAVGISLTFIDAPDFGSRCRWHIIQDFMFCNTKLHLARMTNKQMSALSQY